MPDDVEEFDVWASQPFQPSRSLFDGNNAHVSERVAVALEYIAAQLGEICRKMDHIGAGYTATSEDFEQMKDLLRKL